MTTLEWVLVIYAIVHAVVCVLIYLGIRFRLFRFTEQMMPIIVLVPVAGIFMAVAADYNSRFHKNGMREIELEELHLGNEDLRLREIETDQQGETVVPLEEAMSVNDAELRRKLMQDILRQNPNAYTELLQEARMDDDIEVTHYASTAIMEMQREYELSLQKAERAYQDDPENYEKLNKYLHSLERYLDSGLIDDNIIFVYRNRYAEVLAEKISVEPENMDALNRSVDNYLNMGNISEAMALANRMVAKWPGREDAWFAKLKVCQKSGDGLGIQEVIRQIRARNIYLSPAGRSIVTFWDANAAKER